MKWITVFPKQSFSRLQKLLLFLLMINNQIIKIRSEMLEQLLFWTLFKNIGICCNIKLFYYKINLFKVQLQFLGILQNMLIRLTKKRRENLGKNYVVVWVLIDIFKIFFDTGYFDYTTHNLLIVQVSAYVFFLYQHLYIKQKNYNHQVYMYMFQYTWGKKIGI